MIGAMAEWLGKGLQNLLQRFDSASHLKNRGRLIADLFIFVVRTPHTLLHSSPNPSFDKGGAFVFKGLQSKAAFGFGTQLADLFIFEVRYARTHLYIPPQAPPLTKEGLLYLRAYNQRPLRFCDANRRPLYF